MLVYLVKDDVRHRVTLELNNDAHALAIRLISDIANPLNFFLVNQFGNLLDKPFLVHHERDFANDNLLFARSFDRLGKSLAAHLNNAFAFAVGLDDRFLTMNETAGGEIRSGDVFHELFDRDVWILHHRNQPIDHLTKIVGRNIGRHTDRNTRGTIHQQVRNTRRKNRWFF